MSVRILVGDVRSRLAVMPAELARRCIICSTKQGDIVLDPFGGSGTTALVARGLSRRPIYIELNPAYVEIATRRFNDAPLLSDVACNRQTPDRAIPAGSGTGTAETQTAQTRPLPVIRGGE